MCHLGFRPGVLICCDNVKDRNDKVRNGSLCKYE